MATKVIALDAGHGLYTYGKQTADRKYKEWFLNDKVRDFVVEFLSDYDCKFIYPDKNEGKTDESLASRVAYYKTKGADVVVSIHHNAFRGVWGSATGTEVFVDRNSTAADRELANLIAPKLAKYTGLKNRGVKKENWAVINQNSIPAVLTEGGFMDNKKDYKVITSTAGQKAYAKAVAESLIEFLDLKKKKTSTKTAANATSTKEIKVKFKEEMNVRVGAGTNYAKVTVCKENYTYRITKTKKVNGSLWGYLKSKAGWVCIADKYCTRV